MTQLLPDTGAYRAQLLRFRGDPQHMPDAAIHDLDGLLVVVDGRVADCGAYADVAPRMAAVTAALGAEIPLHDLRGKMIAPGFIDSHIHMPQTDMIASPSEGLLPWLETWTFPSERRFEDAAHAAEVSRFFIDQLLACGTTTALVYCTVHPQSVEALFAESQRRNLRMIAGKTMMDRHCPPFLRDTAESSFHDCAALIERWHGSGRQSYALTPRFAPTSTEAQLEVCATLAKTHPDLFIQTHVAENLDEVRWVETLFPTQCSYLGVYDHYGLLRRRAVYGHAIWLDTPDRLRMADSGAVAAFCPTSNLFLGSGLYDLAAADEAGMATVLATDVGGGTSFSMLQTMNEAHKVARMKGTHLSALRMFYMASAGAAKALELDRQIGTLARGSEADFIVLDPAGTPLLKRRTERAQSLEEWLFAFAMLGDDRAIAATYSMGRRVWCRDAALQ